MFIFALLLLAIGFVLLPLTNKFKNKEGGYDYSVISRNIAFGLIALAGTSPINKRRCFMAKFFMYGKYSQDAMKSISAERTKKALDLIAKSGGKVSSMYALLGKYDIVLITDFPVVADVMKASIALNKLTSIAFTSFPAITIEEFDKITA